ncbi:MAG: OB-fold nucleic acid binding domain-containing protein, partial [Cyanobacteria bacterium J06555_12]
ITKKGDRMAILQLEDLSGSCEAVVFPKTHARIHERLVPDARVMVWAKVDKRDDRKQLIINDLEPLEQVQMVMVSLPADRAGDIAVQHQLAEVLRAQSGDKENRGRIPVVAEVCSGDRRQFVRLGNQFRVVDADVAVRELEARQFNARRQLLLAT